MKFRCISDIHAEHACPGEVRFTLPKLPDEKNMILLLAGDIGVSGAEWSYVPFATEMSERFMGVAHIAGNHEFYGSSLTTARNRIQRDYFKAGISHNVGMHERETIEIGGVRVIMATLWTDMDNNNPITMLEAGGGMNDYRRIRTGITQGTVGGSDIDELLARQKLPRLTVEDTIGDFNKSRRYIFDEIESAKSDGMKILVMTHHAPSRMSISKGFEGSPINGAFVSELSEEILDADCEMTWLHGHVHQSHDYNIGKTRIICNPHGYGNENPLFNPNLVLDI